MKDSIVTIRVPRRVRGTLEALAKREGRSLSSQALRLMEAAMKVALATVATPVQQPPSRASRPLAGSLAGGAVPALEDFREVRGAFSAALDARSRRGHAGR